MEQTQLARDRRTQEVARPATTVVSDVTLDGEWETVEPGIYVRFLDADRRRFIEARCTPHHVRLTAKAETVVGGLMWAVQQYGEITFAGAVSKHITERMIEPLVECLPGAPHGCN